MFLSNLEMILEAIFERFYVVTNDFRQLLRGP